MDQGDDPAVEHESLLQFLYLCPYGMAQFDRSGAISLLNPAFACLAMPLLGSGKALDNLISLLQPFLPELTDLLESSVSEGMICDGKRLYIGPSSSKLDMRVLSLTVVRMDQDRHMAVLSDLTNQVAQERRIKENDAWLQAGVSYVTNYRCQIANLGAAMAAIGVAAQMIVGYQGGLPFWQPLAINVASMVWLSLIVWLARMRKVGVAATGATAGTFATVSLGLLYLNGGLDGSQLYPVLWIYSLIGIVGMYGSQLLTLSAVLAGVSVAVGGKLVIPDLLFGVGADQSWTRVAAMILWWSAGLFATSFSGRQIIKIAKEAIQAREALQYAQAADHVLATNAEQRFSIIATERARSLTGLAHAFDGQVRSMIVTVALTAEQIRARATRLSATAATTGHGAADAASVAAATSADTTTMAKAALHLQDSLEIVYQETRAAAEATNGMSTQVGRSNVALAALSNAADQVGQAVALIRGIAARTKLLALNARIESVGAGEAGRGFRVVAAEVKLLATQTDQATAEVTRLIDSMRAAHKGVAAELTNITQNIERVTAFALHIDRAMENQALAVVSIAQTAAALGDKSRRVSAEVSDVAGSAETTSTAAQEMLQAADVLSKDASSLQHTASAFIVSVHAA